MLRKTVAQRTDRFERQRREHAELGWPRPTADVLDFGPCPRFPPAAVPAPDTSHLNSAHQPGLLALFVAFAKMSLAGFGGVLVWARRGIVDQHRWMTAEEFNETFALCHFLPGPNIVNLSVVFGSRFRGIAGGIAAFAGLVGPPMVIMTILAALYARYGEIDALRRILAGVSCAAVGLLIAVVFRMMMPLIKKRDAVGLVILLGGVHRHRPRAAAAAGGVAGRDPAQSRRHLRDAAAGERMNSVSKPVVDAGLDLRFDVAVCGRRRQFGDAGNAPHRGRRAALDERQAIRRHLRDLAALAGSERADRHPDRLFRRRRCRRAGRDAWRCAGRPRCLPIM